MTTERMLPLYEAKMIHHYDYRWATFNADGTETRNVTLEEKRDPSFQALPRYWVRESVVRDKLGDRADLKHLIGVRDITNSTNERTVISALFPTTAVGNNLPIVISKGVDKRLTATLSSFALDYAARLKVGGTHLNFFIAYQLPVLPPSVFERSGAWLASDSIGDWVDERVDALMVEFGDLDRRALLRAELDAVMFHLYGIEREDLIYIMGTFPIVRANDEKEHGEFRTLRLILEVYDAMSAAMRGGTPYQSAAFEG